MTKETTRYYSYRPEIDGLRALAVIAVIINHTIEELMPSGYLGVDIFFVLSGYVITSSLARREGKSLTYFISSFYARRVKRLVPALVLCVVVTSIFICLFDPTPGVSLKTGLTSLLGLSNIYLYTLSTNYFATSAELNVFFHTWSLGVEEQFYILFPFVIWFTGFSRQASNCTRNIFWVIVVLLSRLADPFTTEKIDQKEKAATYRYYNEDLAQITLKESLDEFIEKLRSLSFELSEKEVDVIIFLPSPEFSFSNPLLCKKEWFRNDELSEKMCSISRNMLIKRIAPLNNSITALAQSVPNLYVYNPFDVICPPPLLAKSSSDCHMYRRDIPLFSDNDHISPDGSILVYKDFTGFLRSNDLDGVQSNPTSSEDG